MGKIDRTVITRLVAAVLIAPGCWALSGCATVATGTVVAPPPDVAP
jgi:hypothetical protein